jgi:hypothetical protein
VTLAELIARERLQESAWDPGQRVAIERYFVTTPGAQGFATSTSTTQARSDDEYLGLLAEAVLARIERAAALDLRPDAEEVDFFVLARVK